MTPVILCGGSGTRLWPLSRNARPKQLLSLTGARSMLQLTLDRISDRRRFAVPLVVTSESQAELIARQLVDTHAPDAALILEPAARNTAPAIALAALTAAPDDLLLIMPSDHLIGDADAFRLAVEKGSELAEQGWLVTFGIRPNRPETGYGYIKLGDTLSAGAFRAESFVEKPEAERAAAYVADGGYLWNAGIFLFRADSFLAALAAHAPEVLDPCRQSVAEGSTSAGRLRPSPDAFGAARSISVDHAVMEHAANIAVVPMDVRWSDVGSWQSLHEISEKDGDDNVAVGDAALLRSSGSLVHSDGPLVVAVGVQDLAIIATGDAVLVVPRGDSQAVRDAVELLKARGDSRL
ncbi:mannose-1-phosphate guanylyltransferase/mannose-6-phosphate isomerase [Sphingomonas deserti]|uniref:mannose-1-phosphate guanylyltransferase n=1 Tax=Allosphingosinicella deserti TaxID=2116704 RepID=A0A2P7QWC5_9SPHN|nr:mannose-1-phosphate guanylyltransferase/mannose-6-phosphate isomerase [Sphingomonas deserti]